jgi:ABC-type antimicrobial peptide transport system permease subunit
LQIARHAIHGVRRSPLRIVLTTLGVTVASGALVSMIGMAVGVQRQVETPFKALAMLNNIQVKPSDDKDKPHPPLDDAMLAQMEKLPGVAAAYPDVHVRGINVRNGKKEAKNVFGIAMPREASLLGVETELVVAGHLFSENDKPEAIVGTQILSELGWKKPADAINQELIVEADGLVPTSGADFRMKKKEFKVTVVGVYDAPPLLPGPARRGILIPVEIMKNLPGVQFEAAMNSLKMGANATPGYSSGTVRVSNPIDIPRVEKQIKDLGFNTRTVMSQLQNMRKYFIAVQLLLTVVGSVALLIAALGIANTLLMAVLERYQEIGLCKAIGASDGDLFVLFLTEAAIIGFAGGVSGLIFGWSASRILESLAEIYARQQGVTDSLDIIVFPPWLLFASVAFSVVVSIVAGIYPALRAARIDPIKALRSQ